MRLGFLYTSIDFLLTICERVFHNAGLEPRQIGTDQDADLLILRLFKNC